MEEYLTYTNFMLFLRILAKHTTRRKEKKKTLFLKSFTKVKNRKLCTSMSSDTSLADKG